jgi:UDP-glucose 4-epimerase
MVQHSILVTGGAGYIGSHVVHQLIQSGYNVVIYDNGSVGSSNLAKDCEFVLGDLCDIDRLYQVFACHSFSAVLHFAASLSVPESVAHPLDYYANNTRNTLNLLRCCKAMGVHQLVFSSTAAVYGQPTENPVTEATLTTPINPYGRSKLMSEWLIQDYELTSPLRYVILRYFNVAGASLNGKLGQPQRGNHLIASACNAVIHKKPMNIYGTDFPTPDGTAIRDFIHVEDLATAHLDALRYLENDGHSQTFNCGYGQGYSVRQVVDRVQTIANMNFPILECDRRPGDPAAVVACSKKIRQELNWHPQYNSLDTIIKTALLWEIRREQRTVEVSTPKHLDLYRLLHHVEDERFLIAG